MLRLALGGFENLEGHSCDRCGYSSRYEDVCQSADGYERSRSGNVVSEIASVIVVQSTVARCVKRHDVILNMAA